MAQREMNFTDLTKSIENVKQLAEQQRGHTFKYEIWYKNPYVSGELMQAGSGASNTTPNVVDQFKADFDAVLNMDNVVYIKVIMKSKGKIIAQPEIIFKPEYAQAAPAFPQKKDEPAKALDIDMNQPLKNSALGVNAVLDLMGFGGLLGGINTSDDNTGGLATVMAIRDKLHDEQREKSDNLKRIEELIAEKTKLEVENADLKRQIEENTKEKEEHATALNGFNDEMESLKEELAEAKETAEKGRTLGGLLGTALLSIAKQKAPQLSAKLPMLGGVFEALATDDEPQQQQVAAAENEPRADQYNEFLKYARSLDDNDFAKLWKVICKCARDKAAIDAILGQQPATAVNGDDDTEETETEDIE